MKNKPAVKVTKKPVQSKDNVILFPKGPSLVKGVFDLEFGAIVNPPNAVVARYKVIPKDTIRYKDMVRDLKPSFGRKFCLIPGIQSMFIVPKSTDCLEYVVSIDMGKAKSYFDSAMYFKIKQGSIISMDFIKSILKAHINRFHKF